MSAEVSAPAQLEMRQLEMSTIRNECWVCVRMACVYAPIVPAEADKESQGQATCLCCFGTYFVLLVSRAKPHKE